MSPAAEFFLGLILVMVIASVFLALFASIFTTAEGPRWVTKYLVMYSVIVGTLWYHVYNAFEAAKLP